MGAAPPALVPQSLLQGSSGCRATLQQAGGSWRAPNSHSSERGSFQCQASAKEWDDEQSCSAGGPGRTRLQNCVQPMDPAPPKQCSILLLPCHEAWPHSSTQQTAPTLRVITSQPWLLEAWPSCSCVWQPGLPMAVWAAGAGRQSDSGGAFTLGGNKRAGTRLQP